MLCCECVSTSNVAIVERCGQYSRTQQPGLLVYVWPLENVVSHLSVRTRMLKVSCETKTKDNVFVRVIVSVQFRVINNPHKARDAFYKLTNRDAQIRSYVEDVIRSAVPRMDLDTAFISKDDIAKSVKEDLQDKMDDFGYEIVQSLVTDLSPDEKVKSSMNDINASRRQRIAAGYRADAEKIALVKNAEADAEQKYLSGVGVAKQRKAIIDGLRESIAEFSDKVTETSSKDIMTVLLMTQYFDMLDIVGTHNGAKAVFLPGVENSQTANIRNGLLQANAMMRR